ncbi:MAG: type II toxin-antitoxin system mRNA interferase toxin, RelE/StbE family [Candidatus Chisholmbacteria bacterium]|nr:type II toxin-antitoxin system mRNA interferase toxin, RelE/StbE family [Candidatus Chisholmbacteria bacterium]
MTSVYYTSVFAKHFKRLPKRIKLAAVKQEKRFRANPLQPRLKTHVLGGKLKGYYSFSVTYRYRILFAIEKGGEITFIDIGTHSIY